MDRSSDLPIFPSPLGPPNTRTCPVLEYAVLRVVVWIQYLCIRIPYRYNMVPTSGYLSSRDYSGEKQLHFGASYQERQVYYSKSQMDGVVIASQGEESFRILSESADADKRLRHSDGDFIPYTSLLSH
jgi:hypothetical protein